MATEVSDRGSDKIVKVEMYSRDVNSLHALVLKQSKSVDFYYNGAKLFASASLSNPVSARMLFYDIG